MADKSEEYILGIEIAESALRVMQRHIPTNTVDLVHIEPLNLADAVQGDNLALLLKQVVRLYRKLFKTRYAVVSLPYSMAYVRILQLDGESDDVREQIEWEFEQETVGKTGKHVFDWISLDPPPSAPVSGVEAAPQAAEENIEDMTLDKEMEAEMAAEEAAGPDVKEKSGIRPALPVSFGSRYLMVAVEEERLQWMENSLKKLKIVPLICDVDALALINIFTQNYPEEINGLVALVYLTGNQALLTLTQNGQYLDGDRIGPVLFDSPEAVQASVKLIEERITGLSPVPAGKPASGIARCFVCGDAAADARFRDPLLAAFTLPVEALDPFRSVSVAPEIKSQVQMVSAALAVVTGLTLRSTGEA